MEYENDEENTDAFFDTSKWTGNLRVTPFDYKIENAITYFSDKITEMNAVELKWKDYHGIKYVEKSLEETIYFWQLIKCERLYVCSFTIGNISGNEIKQEIEKIEKTLKTIDKNLGAQSYNRR